MIKLHEYTDGLRQVADAIHKAAESEPFDLRAGADISITVPAERLAHAAGAFGYGQPWESMVSGAGFTRTFGPHRVWLLAAEPAPALSVAPDPLADPDYASRVQVLHAKHRGLAPRGDAA